MTPTELRDWRSECARLERRLLRLRDLVVELDGRLSRVENSLFFRTLRGIGRRWSDVRGRAGQALLHSPAHRWYARFRPAPPNPYPAWISAVEAAAPVAAQLERKPLISVLMPVYRARLEWLQAAIDSVRTQVYPRWELCIALDGPDPGALQVVEQLAAGDARIRYTASPEQAGISNTLNRAGELSNGDYLAFLDQDDLLSPAALHAVVQAMEHTDADVVYTDEDWIGPSGERLRPNFKPGWSPELLLSCMYLGHLLVVSRTAMYGVDGFRPEFDGAQDYDLALRIDEQGARFAHVPRVLYHWRTHEQSTAASPEAKPYAHEAGRRALAESLARRGAGGAEVVDGPMPHTYRVRRRPPAGQGISFVIVSRTPRLLDRCLASVERTAAQVQREYIVVHHRQGAPSDTAMEPVLGRYRCTVVPYMGSFNFSAMNNAGARRAQHAVLVFLNDDVTALEPGWAEALLAQAARPDIGAAGARLVYASGALQHSGVVLGMGQGTGHAGRGSFRSDIWRWLELTRDVAAVTGACMAVRREVFEQLDGFDPGFPVNYNDVDFCLRAREAGYRIVLETAAVLRHDEARTRMPGTNLIERERFFDRWDNVLADPFYSPWLDRTGEAISLGSASR